MTRPLKSQWEFGELFPAEQIRKVLTVSEVTGSIRRLLEKELGQVWVTGEITNLRVQSSGHIYFSIKDASTQLSCVLFKNEARVVNRDYLEDGKKVVLSGEITVYEARGQYQLIVSSVELQGLGALQAAFERLKQKLQAEGLFDAARKRQIPRFARAIGLVTSPSGAAIRDVLHAIERRNPSLRVVLAPCRVQGAGAGAEIATAIHLLNEWSANAREPLDLILVTRGGGSLEDLWAFNEEVVARAICNSLLPVVSGVGHEIDFTICDFAADFRAATPTAAAEIITEGIFSSRQFIAEVRQTLHDLACERLGWKVDELNAAFIRMGRVHPRRKLQELAQFLDDLQLSLKRCVKQQFRAIAERNLQLISRLARTRPTLVICRQRERLLVLHEDLRSQVKAELQERKQSLRDAASKLRLLSPLNVLERGYSITLNARTNEIVRDASQVEPGAEILSRVKKGEIRSVVRGSKDGRAGS